MVCLFYDDDGDDDDDDDEENQLNELEQRLAQTERMLNSILTQLDPLTNW